MKNKNKQPASAGRMPALVGCCRVLGLRNGFRYWRLQNKAIRDPFMALRWASEIRHEAKLEAEKGNKLTAELMDCFADEMMERNRQFHTPNAEPRRGDDGTNLK